MGWKAPIAALKANKGLSESVFFRPEIGGSGHNVERLAISLPDLLSYRSAFMSSRFGLLPLVEGRPPCILPVLNPALLLFLLSPRVPDQPALLPAGIPAPGSRPNYIAPGPGGAIAPGPAQVTRTATHGERALGNSRES